MEHKFVCTYISMLMFYIFLQSSEWVKPFRVCEEFQHVYNSSYCQCSFKNEGDLLPPCVDNEHLALCHQQNDLTMMVYIFPV